MKMDKDSKVPRTARDALRAAPLEMRELDRRIRKLAREQPLLCLAVALAGGYIAGRIVARA